MSKFYSIPSTISVFHINSFGTWQELAIKKRRYMSCIKTRILKNRSVAISKMTRCMFCNTLFAKDETMIYIVALVDGKFTYGHVCLSCY